MHDSISQGMEVYTPKLKYMHAPIMALGISIRRMCCSLPNIVVSVVMIVGMLNNTVTNP